jgi:hypothetical protein
MSDLKTLAQLDYMPQHGDVVQRPDGSLTGMIDGEWRYEIDMPVYRMFVLHSEQYPEWIGKYHQLPAEAVFQSWQLVKKKKTS